MRKLVSIKDCGGKTIDPDMPPDLFYDEAAIHFTDGTTAILHVEADECCDDQDAWIGNNAIEGIEKATDRELINLFRLHVITSTERDAERARRRKAGEAAQAEERRKQYEQLKAEFEAKQ